MMTSLHFKLSRTAIAIATTCAFLAPTSSAQVGGGEYVYGAFSPQRGRIGLFTSHPRKPGTPQAIENLQGDLTVTGSSCIAYRRSDGALVVGERAPAGSSLDLHVILLRGNSVLFDASYSLGKGGTCCPEIPQLALLSGDRVLVAVTDIASGPLKNYQTTAYGWQGVGIVDTRSGLITPITITNGASILDVFNGLALSPDGMDVYLGTYVSSTQGDIWKVALTGGVASKIASVPAGLSGLSFDATGQLWVTTLDPMQGLFRVAVDTFKVQQVPQSNGSLNAITYDDVTGNFAVLSANSGLPSRSVFWMEPSGKEHLLANPGYGTLSGIAINPSLELHGNGTPGSASYAWTLPNPNGLPLIDSSSFGLTIDVTGSPRPGWAAFSAGCLKAPLDLLGAALWLDPMSFVFTTVLPAKNTIHMPLPIPNDASLSGVRLFVQSFHLGGQLILASSPAIEMKVL